MSLGILLGQILLPVACAFIAIHLGTLYYERRKR